MIHIGNLGLELIKFYEQPDETKIHTPYRCPAGFITTGFGHVITFKKDVAIQDLPQQWQWVSEEQAEALLVQDTMIAVNAMTSLLKAKVVSSMEQHQIDAVASFIFNIGSGNFQSSGIRQKLNRKDWHGATMEFQKWRRASKQILKGLVIRRCTEAHLFRSGQLDFQASSKYPELIF